MLNTSHLVSALLAFCAIDALAASTYDEEPIRYSTTSPNDPIARLKQQLDAGILEIKYDDKFGFLPAILKHLKVPISSQMLVFSKTSMQAHRIAPETPRALYFNDDVYVGFCKNGDVLEIASTDPRQGAMFYTLSQKNAGKPVLTRQTDKCLQCHDSSSLTLGVPGHIMRSVYPDTEGRPIYSAGTHHTTQESPFKERWGGWYVTGTHGSMLHMGNTLIKDRDHAEKAEFAQGLNVTDLKRFLDTSCYLSPHSDIVALMVSEHQTVMHNLITNANFEMRAALRQEVEMNKALGEPADHRLPSTLSRLKSVAEPLLKYMLYCDEAPFSDPIRGTAGFAEEFSKTGPRDARGRSLRDFDLQTRLFKYPCSHLVYSDSFNALPPLVMDYIRSRLTDIFNGAEKDPAYSRLTADDRANIRAILADTWPGAPAEWKK